jgi:hypothetical protein
VQGSLHQYQGARINASSQAVNGPALLRDREP